MGRCGCPCGWNEKFRATTFAVVGDCCCWLCVQYGNLRRRTGCVGFSVRTKISNPSRAKAPSVGALGVTLGTTGKFACWCAQGVLLERLPLTVEVGVPPPLPLPGESCAAGQGAWRGCRAADAGWGEARGS